MRSLTPLKARYQLAFAGAFCVFGLCGCKRQQQVLQAPPPPEVATITISCQQVVITRELPGHTSPYLIAEIRPQVNGLIQKRLFTEGSDVKAGQELYQIDPAPFQAALENAKAALGRAEANLPARQLRLDRYKQALAEKAVSQQDYDDAAAALKQAQADIDFYKAMVETAKINLGYSRVVSPISGRIGVSSVTDGAIVTAYQPTALATIQQLDPIYVNVPQSAAQMLSLQKKLEEKSLTPGTGLNRVQLMLADGSKYPLEGTLQFRDITVDPTTGSVNLRMLFPNPKGLLLPGMFVRALIQEGVNEQGILVAQQSVFRDPKGDPIALVVDASGKVSQRLLTLDRAIGDQWLVSSGLNPGDHVIAEGMQKVRTGATVRELPFQGTSNRNSSAAAASPSQAALGNK